MKRIVAVAVSLVLALLLVPGPARAQQTITAQGRVVDAQGNPIPDVQVLLEYRGHIVQKYRTKTDKRGVFTHVNVFSGPYHVTLKKEGMGEVSFDTNLQEIESLQKPPDYKFVPKTAAAVPAPPGSGLAPAGGTLAPVNAAQLTTEINNAVALSHAGNVDGAIAAYDAILAQAPQIPLVHYNVAGLYKKKGDLAKAEAEMRKSVELDPQFVDGWVGTATVLADEGKTPGAIEVIRQGLAQNPQSGRLQYALGILAERTGDTPAAKQAFLEAEKLDPQNTQTQFHLATVALNQNDQAEAVSRLQKFVATAPPGTPDLETAKSLLAALQKK